MLKGQDVDHPRTEVLEVCTVIFPTKVWCLDYGPEAGAEPGAEVGAVCTGQEVPG